MDYCLVPYSRINFCQRDEVVIQRYEFYEIATYYFSDECYSNGTNPTTVYYHLKPNGERGGILKEIFKKNGKVHRDDLNGVRRPAKITYNILPNGEQGSIKMISFWKFGRLFGLNEKAVIRFN